MAKQIALILHQDGTTSEVEYAEKDSLKTMQSAVGGYIESVAFHFRNVDAYANEEGLYAEGLAVNETLAQAGIFVMGNVVFPRMTPGKRAKIAKVVGFEV